MRANTTAAAARARASRATAISWTSASGTSTARYPPRAFERPSVECAAETQSVRHARGSPARALDEAVERDGDGAGEDQRQPSLRALGVVDPRREDQVRHDEGDRRVAEAPVGSSARKPAQGSGEAAAASTNAAA